MSPMDDTPYRFLTAGTVVEVRSQVPRLQDAVLAASGGQARLPYDPARPAEVTLVLETGGRFETAGLEPITRGAWAGPGGEVILDDVGGSGYTQRWLLAKDRVQVQTRWAPSAKAGLAARALPARFRALQAQMLLHYPVLWRAAQHGRVPLHVSVVEVHGVAVLLAGPGGLGKSTLVAHELDSGASAACDNIAVSSGGRLYGLAEPLRLAGGSGRRGTHGRRERPFTGRVSALDPELVVVLRRGASGRSEVIGIDPVAATRALTGGTYAAGELQRFWPLCATLALATGSAPVHPPVEAVASSLCSRLPCFELAAGRAGERLVTLLGEQLSDRRRRGVPT